MKQRYLEITFRKGRALAAYLYLPRESGARVARTVGADRGLKIDLDERDTPIGVELTAPAAVTIAELNAVLAQHGIAALDEDEWADPAITRNERCLVVVSAQCSPRRPPSTPRAARADESAPTNL